jgi:glycosyltransferase involved in cell wall biosynthesis
MQFSVVIPLYNKAPYITRAINSVLSQTFRDFEIIVVDDGSTDRGGDIVAAMVDPRIKVIRQVNAGVSAARNRGIEEAEADLIAFLDADDEWKSGFLEVVHDLSVQFPNCGGYATSYDVVESNLKLNYPRIKGIPSNQWTGIILNLFRVLQSGLPFNASSIVVPKKVLLKINGFPVGVKRGEDAITWIKIGIDFPIAFSSNRQVIYHRDAANRVCNMSPEDGVQEICKIMDEMLANQRVPVDLISDFIGYYSSIVIHKARQMIKAGQMETARVLLLRTAKSQKFYKESIFLELLSYVPVSMIRIILKSRLFLWKITSE